MRFAILMVVVILALGSVGRYLYEGVFSDFRADAQRSQREVLKSGHSPATSPTGQPQERKAAKKPATVQTNPFSD